MSACLRIQTRIALASSAVVGGLLAGPAGLIFDAQFYNVHSVADLSRYFPVYEARKMRTLHVSPGYPTWDEAFAHEFGGAA